MREDKNMKSFTKVLLGAASLTGILIGNAMAQDAAPPAPAPDFALTGAVALQSDYRFRGISQNNSNVAPQGTLNLTGPDGFYVGTWLSKTDWKLNNANNNPSFEMDIYGGKHFDIGFADLNVEAYYYAYPDASQPAGSKKASYLEGITQLSHTFGPLTLTGTYAYSPVFSLGGGAGNYVEGTASYTIFDWLSVSSNVGHQYVQNAKKLLAANRTPGRGDYTHADVGATGTWHNFALDLRYVGNDLSDTTCAVVYMPTKNACRDTFVATLTYNVNLLP
jgi:uncharacterized protein (TIGR02001 family)